MASMSPQQDRRLFVFLDRFTGRRPARRCEIADCKRATNMGKPYCATHLLHHPYAREVAETWEAMGEVDSE